jgi:lysozyme
MSERGRDWLAQLEGGYRLKAYLCPAGVWTISAGVTRYSDASNARVKKGDVLADRDSAVKLFGRSLLKYETGVDGLTRDDLVQHQFDALVSFAFNLGLGALATSTLIKVVNKRGTDPEVRQQLLRWRFADTDPNHAGLEEVEGLRLRREAEALVYARGPYLDTRGVADYWRRLTAGEFVEA